MAETDKQSVPEKPSEPTTGEYVRNVPPGILARSAPSGETRPDQRGCYGFKGGVIAFVDGEGRLFVTPGTQLKLDLLEEAGFTKPKPQINVPYSDGSVKSKRWLRKVLPKAEIMRSVEENSLPKVEARVYAGLLKVNLEGLKTLPGDFINDRCAKVKEKYYHYIGLCASYRGILSFTDWEADTYVTPYSEAKKELLEAHGYVYVESMIKVPYSLENKENRNWLARNIPAGEWPRTEEEVEQARLEESLRKAKEKIEQLGLKDLPDDLLAGAAACEESYPNYIGMAGSHNGILSFTDPLGRTRVTPATQAKVELLKSLGYQFMGSAIKVPHSLKGKEDIAWLRAHIGEETWEQARKAAAAELKKLEIEQTEKRQRSLGLQDLPPELLDHSLRTGSHQPNYCGKYFIRNDILGFVDASGMVSITPSTRKKTELLKAANYQPAAAGFILPHSDGTPADLEYIRRYLSREDLEESAREREEDTEAGFSSMLRKLIEQRKIGKLSGDLLARSVRTGIRQIDLLGHYCSRGGVTCFIYEDGYFYVTQSVPWKEAALKEAGYRLPEQLVRVPYGSGTEEDRRWLDSHLPAVDLEKSRQELDQLETENRERELKERLKKLGISEKVPPELAARSAKTPELNEDQIGHYLIHEELIAFVGPDGRVWITPYTPSKIKLLEEAAYQQATRKISVPFSADSEGDVAWRKDNFPEGELLRSRQEKESLDKNLHDDKINKNLEKYSLKPLEKSVLVRFADSGEKDPHNIGRLGVFRGVLALVGPDEKVWVSWYTPEKQEFLEQCGYKLEGRLPIKVPYALPSARLREWLIQNLPEPDEEETVSMEENREGL